jgi:hypothetical protein
METSAHPNRSQALRNRSIVGALALLLTSCVGSGTATTAAVSETATEPPPITTTDSIEPSTRASTPPTSKAFAGDDASDDEQEGASDDPSDVRWVEEPHDWVLTEVDGATLTLWVAVGSGTCDRFDRVDVTETEEEISIVAVVDSATGPSKMVCTASMITLPVEVTLDQPLDSREVTGCRLNREGSNFDDDRGIDRASCADLVADAYSG